MYATDGSLLIVDEQGVLPLALLDRLKRIGSLLVSRSVDETRDRIESGNCRAVLVAVSGNPFATLSLALCVHEMDPGLPVMVMDDDFEPRLTRLAVRAGFRLIAKDDDEQVLTAWDADRLEPAVVFL